MNTFTMNQPDVFTSVSDGCQITITTQMETTEMNTAGPEGSQKGEMLSPSEESTPPVLTGTSGALNFSTLTPHRFGISVQSFTPAASADRKDKSRLAQIKARRRSSIGVRGSPETNSLIRFMAQQRLKTPKNVQTPEPVSRSPFPPRVASTLRQKMASFQSLMDVEETDVCDLMPRQDGNTGGCIKTRDYLSDGSCKENHPPQIIPSAKKRRCLAPFESCEVEIREASAPALQFQSKEQEDETTRGRNLNQGAATSSETVTDAKPDLISPPLTPATCSPTKILQDGSFELQSLSQPLTAAPSFHFPSLPGLLEMKPTGDDDSTGSSPVKKKKRVRFGGPLTPEFFDKNLPPSTPLQKGATPGRAPTPGGGLQLRSLLKTPQRSEPKTLQAQSDLCSPTLFGASPTLAMPRNFGRKSVEGDAEEDGKVVFPSMEEIDSAETSDTGYLWDSQPLNLNSAFHEESLSQIVAESEIEPSSVSQMVVQDEPASSPEKPETSAPVRSNKRRKKQPEAVCESTSEAPARSGSRKRKLPQQPEESEPVKRSTRSAAKMASGKMKMTSAAARRWNRDVDPSLYGSRTYASKNPTLSPISERLSFINQSPAAQQASSASCTKHTAPTQEIPSDLETAYSREDELTVTHENPSEDSVKSPYPRKEIRARKGKRLTRPRGRGTQKRNGSVADFNLLCEEPQDEAREQTKEHREDQTTTNPEASRETPLWHTAEGDIKLEAETPADIPSTNSEGPASLNALLPSNEELNQLCAPAEFSQEKAEGRSSSVDQVQEHQMSHEVEDNNQEDQAENQLENCRSSSDSKEQDRPFNLDLAPWQADFNFEDVFKSVTTRGQRSVRRSLRNQRKAVEGIGAGLAWLPRSSPNLSKEARRRTRGRRLSAALPSPPSVSEETQDNAL